MTRKRKTAIARSACLVLLASASGVFAGSHPERREARAWHDMERRIQFYYYTEDAHGLQTVQPQLTGLSDKTGRLSGYYSAYLAYRQTQLALRSGRDLRPMTDSEKTQVRALLSRCVSSLEPVLAGQKDFAEGFALQGACLAMEADLESFWRAPIAFARSALQLRRAQALAPDNPRVLLLHAMAGYSRDADKSAEELKRAIEAFEAEPQDAAHLPGWGKADAYEMMARIHLQHGEALQARDALERSLLQDPGYLAARRLLLQIIS